VSALDERWTSHINPRAQTARLLANCNPRQKAGKKSGRQ